MDSCHKAATCQLWLSSTGNLELPMSSVVDHLSGPKPHSVVKIPFQSSRSLSLHPQHGYCCCYLNLKEPPAWSHAASSASPSIQIPSLLQLLDSQGRVRLTTLSSFSCMPHMTSFIVCVVNTIRSTGSGITQQTDL